MFRSDPQITGAENRSLDRSQRLGINDYVPHCLFARNPNWLKKETNVMTDEIRVMTSGAFTAAYRELIPELERLTRKKIVTAATSIGSGETSIPNRLRRGEAVDVVIVADGVLVGFIEEGLVTAESYTPLARSAIGMAVKAGAPKPDIGTVDALKRTLLSAKSIAYSASVSGDYLSTELLQRLGIADQVLGKCRRVEGGERVGAVVARGEAEIGFQQISELLPISGIDHVTPLPAEVQKVSVFSGGVAANSSDPAVSKALIKFLASPDAGGAIKDNGLEPIKQN